uniref:Uncharacterized protein n=1 Tax=Cyanoptyche gloeocystis TaxID=77922 RepID=A0A7S2JJW0_9EUKA|mmetsp:Transcript_1262/g.2408  ORF Transcript_1262/g.2408 Transcript_1262/m.2408 type:complete len:214 (+) Transcript_1262:115-756(+)
MGNGAGKGFDDFESPVDSPVAAKRVKAVTVQNDKTFHKGFESNQPVIQKAAQSSSKSAGLPAVAAGKSLRVQLAQGGPIYKLQGPLYLADLYTTLGWTLQQDRDDIVYLTHAESGHRVLGGTFKPDELVHVHLKESSGVEDQWRERIISDKGRKGVVHGVGACDPLHQEEPAPAMTQVVNPSGDLRTPPRTPVSSSRDDFMPPVEGDEVRSAS